MLCQSPLKLAEAHGKSIWRPAVQLQRRNTFSWGFRGFLQWPNPCLRRVGLTIGSRRASQNSLPEVWPWMLLYLHLIDDFLCLSLPSGASLGGSTVKDPPANAGDPHSIPGSARSPGEGNGNPLQYSCPENPMDRGACQSAIHGVAKSWTQLSTHG